MPDIIRGAIHRRQAGSTASGSPLRVMTLTPASPDASQFVLELGGAAFGGVQDSVAYVGFNVQSGGNRIDTSRSRISLNLEDQFNDGGIDTTEAYLEFQDTSGTYIVRPFMFQMRRSPTGYADSIRQSYFRGNPVTLQHPNGVDELAAFYDGSSQLRGSAGVSGYTLEIIAGSGEPSIQFKQGATSRFTLASGGSGLAAVTIGATTTLMIRPGQLGINGDTTGLLTAQFTASQSANMFGIVARARATPGTNQDLFRAETSAAAALWRINKDGYMAIRKVTAPADGDLVASEYMVWFDATDGAAKLKIKGKSVNGTVVAGEVALA